jgi:hypothetical protein
MHELDRDEQNPDASSSGRLHFLRRRLIFVGPQYGLAACHPSDALNCGERDAGTCESFCGPGLGYSIPRKKNDRVVAENKRAACPTTL